MNKKFMEQMILGRPLEEALHIPSCEESLNRLTKIVSSGYDLMSLGYGTDGNFWITEEERENHVNLIGTTGEGKSKFIEYLCQNDIDRGNGFMLLDPSTGGQTVKDVLKYCAKIGHEKVIVIDPDHRWKHKKIIGLNPFHTSPSLIEASIANVADMLRVVFGTKDSSETPLINKVLPAVLHVLHNKKLSLYETLYFSDFKYHAERRWVLDQNNRYASYLRGACSDGQGFSEVLGSTVRRLEPLFHDTLSLMLAMTNLDWTKIVREKYIVLVNLSSFRLEPIHNRLLGTLLINQLIFAIDRMFANGWKGVYYLYFDEAGEYATRKLAHLLAYKRKTGLRLNIAYQYESQFEDKYVLDAIKNLTKTKIAFYIPNAEDRMKFIKNAYGGDLADRDVSYVLGQLKKQHAVIKKGKQEAAVIRIPDVKTPDIDTKSYVEKILSQPFYFTPEEIKDVITQRQNSFSPARGTSTKHRTNNPANGGQGEQRTDSAKKTQGEKQTDKDNPTQPKTDPFALAEELERAERDNDQT